MTDREFDALESRVRELERSSAQQQAILTLLRFGLPILIALFSLAYAILADGGAP